MPRSDRVQLTSIGVLLAAGLATNMLAHFALRGPKKDNIAMGVMMSESMTAMADRTGTALLSREASGSAGMRIRTAVNPKHTKVTIKNLDFFYGKFQALKGVSLEVPDKQVTGLIGPSGCGKSTLLRVLNRLYEMYPGQRVTGEVRVDGADILGPNVDLNSLRNRIGMVFQVPTPLPMSIYDNIAFGAKLYEKLTGAEIDERVEGSLARAALWTEVKDRLSAPAGALSIGQQQRLCIARALAARPEVILLDEPCSALDPISTAKIEQLIDELKQDLAIVIVTHNIQQAARCADRVAFLYLGDMVEVGSVAQMFKAPQQLRTQNFIAGRFG